MAVKENAPKADDLNLKETPGFHVVADGTYCGTYQSRDDAQAYIDGHITPQDKNAEIVEGSLASA
jgi:hypothetical protein